MKNKVKNKIAVLLSPWSVDYVDKALKGMQKACKEHNSDLYVFASYKFAEADGVFNTTGFAIYDLIKYSDYDGIIIIPSFFNDDDFVEKERKKIVASGVPCVSLNTELKGISFIYSENHQSYVDLVQHLVKVHNVTDFAYIGGPSGNQGAISSLNAFKEALAQENITVNDSDVYMNGDWSYDYGYSTGNIIFAKEKIPQAIVCVNDQAAMGAITSAAEHNIKVPDQVRIIGLEKNEYSEKVIPSITTIDTCIEEMGEAAVNQIFSENKEIVREKIIAEPCFNQSCGCKKDITPEQVRYSQRFQKEVEKDQRFASQLRHLEASFIKNENVYELPDNLQKYFTKRHIVEGPDFAILLNNRVIESLKQKLITPNESQTFDKTMMVITSIKNGEAEDVAYKMQTKELYPECMKSDEPSLYLFLPIFNHNYLHGYYVAKNNYVMLFNKCAYNWTRNFGTIIEKFRTTSVYRILGEQFKKLSMQDSLSGLLNRAGLQNFAVDMFTQNKADKKSTIIIFIDINNMKVINDKHGHLHGDLAVKTVAECIKASIPKEYLAVRYGGDEFVIIGTCKKNADSMHYINKINEQLKLKEERMSLPYSLTVSCGAKVFNYDEYDDNQDLIAAIEIVDDLMYKEKTAFHKEQKKANKNDK